MLKPRIYILQLLGILMLACGYFLGDEPDSLSVMHIDSNPACPSVITKAIKTNVNGFVFQTTVSSKDNTPRKIRSPKCVSYEVVLPHKSGYVFHPLNQVVYTCALPENYAYLFYEEINPPPPKASSLCYNV